MRAITEWGHAVKQNTWGRGFIFEGKEKLWNTKKD